MLYQGKRKSYLTLLVDIPNPSLSLLFVVVVACRHWLWQSSRSKKQSQSDAKQSRRLHINHLDYSLIYTSISMSSPNCACACLLKYLVMYNYPNIDCCASLQTLKTPLYANRVQIQMQRKPPISHIRASQRSLSTSSSAAQ